MKKIILLGLLLPALHLSSVAQKLRVPLGGNSWITTHSASGSELITEDGWKNWTERETIFSTYVYLAKPGKLKISAVVSLLNGRSRIQTTIGNVAKSIFVKSSAKETTLGEWTIGKAGYVRIDLKGLSRTGAVFANLENLIISGSAVDNRTAFVRNNEGNYFYWGRRGPSVHLNFDTSQIGDQIEYFYSEIKVPAGNDVIGSYFMANGFAEGYFGIQVNSETERRVLFSVWSPFRTDDPSKIPADKRILMLRKGKDVTTREFGNEGSGGQSFLRFNWRSGETYRFLLKGEPDRDNYTNYTAWFFDGGQWRLIAGFSRPATNTYLKSLHSFLENFKPETGNITREAHYQNQWVRTKAGVWKPLTRAQFTYDNTARKNYRIDYAGGSSGAKFYLRNCGFFSHNTPYQTAFARSVDESAPQIDLSRLE